jgi:hypothetical protein
MDQFGIRLAHQEKDFRHKHGSSRCIQDVSLLQGMRTSPVTSAHNAYVALERLGSVMNNRLSDGGSSMVSFVSYPTAQRDGYRLDQTATV